MFDQHLLETLQGIGIPEQFRLLADRFPGQVAFSTSFGQEDQVIMEIIAREDLPVRIFTLDTGRLFNETYELIDLTRLRYRREIEVFFPDTKRVEALVNEKGFTSFYESVENRKECCHIRKVEPLNRALKGVTVWVTGLRAGQSDNRKDLPLLEWDASRGIYKYNPLISWTHEQVLQHLSAKNVPYNPLHDKGFVSIGCAPCTRAIEPGEDPRAGRWWWEQSQKECGLHFSQQSAVSGQQEQP